MPKQHDDTVLKVAEALAEVNGIRIHVDLPASYEHAFEAKVVLPREPPLMLAAMVPTQAVFTTKPVLPNAHWKEPDIVVVADAFRYVIDVHDDNDTFAAIARKVESVIACAREWNIVGLAMIAKGHDKPYSARQADLDRMRTTFWSVVGAERVNDDSVVPYLSALVALPGVGDLYGRPMWDRVRELHVEHRDWKEALLRHVRETLLDNPRAMVS